MGLEAILAVCERSIGSRIGVGTVVRALLRLPRHGWLDEMLAILSGLCCSRSRVLLPFVERCSELGLPAPVRSIGQCAPEGFFDVWKSEWSSSLHLILWQLLDWLGHSIAQVGDMCL